MAASSAHRISKLLTSREHFEMRTHKRLIDIIDPNAE